MTLRAAEDMTIAVVKSDSQPCGFPLSSEVLSETYTPALSRHRDTEFWQAWRTPVVVITTACSVPITYLLTLTSLELVLVSESAKGQNHRANSL